MNRFDHLPTTEPGQLLDREERSAMVLLRFIAAAGLAVMVLGLALRLSVCAPSRAANRRLNPPGSRAR